MKKQVDNNIQQEKVCKISWETTMKKMVRSTREWQMSVNEIDTTPEYVKYFIGEMRKQQYLHKWKFYEWLGIIKRNKMTKEWCHDTKENVEKWTEI